MRAWDIGLAHPDFVAGYAIVATAEKMCSFIGRTLSTYRLYFVCGELDGDKMAKKWTGVRSIYESLRPPLTARSWNTKAAGTRIFPTKFCDCSIGWDASTATSPASIHRSTNRPFDNYFWWLELPQLPAEREDAAGGIQI